MRRRIRLYLVVVVLLVMGGVTGVDLYRKITQVPVTYADLVWKGFVQTDILCLGFSKDGRTLAVADKVARVRLLRPDCGEIQEVAQGPPAKLFRAEFSPGADYLACEGHQLELRGVRSGVRTSVPTTASAMSLDFSPDGRYLAVACYDGDALIWDVRRSRTVKILKHDQPRRGYPVYMATFSADGATLATQDYNRAIRLWDTRYWRLMRTIVPDSDHRRGQLLGWGPDGKSLVVWTFGHSNRRLEVRSTSASNRDHTLWVSSLVRLISVDPSPKGMLLAYGVTRDIPNIEGYESSVSVWSLESGNVSELALETGASVSVAFSPDGKMLAAGFSNGMVYVWRVSYPPERRSLLDTAESLVSRLWKAPSAPAPPK